MWEFNAADRLHWHPGKRGKGLVTQRGEVHTWPIDAKDSPHHAEYTSLHPDLKYPPNGSRFLFQIDPDGGVHDGGINFMNNTGQPDENILGQISAADERLYAADPDKEENDWELPPWDEAAKPQGGPDYNFINSATGFHHHPVTGLPCRCNFGHRRFGHNSHRTAGVEWNRFTKKQMGKKFMARPGAQHYVDAMDNYINEHDPNDWIDGLVPFLNKEFKAGRIRGSTITRMTPGEEESVPALRWGEGGDQGPRVSWDRLHEWGQWNAARQHPTRRGVNILDPEFQTEHIDSAARQFREQEAERERYEMYKDQLADAGEVVHEWPDKWHIKDLTQGGGHPSENMELEGEVMNHCIGNDDEHPFDGYGYKSAVANGDIDNVYSLRDPQGMPHATFHTNSNGDLAEINGHSNQSLNDEYNKRVAEFLDEAGHRYNSHNGRVSGFGNYFENPNEEEEEPEEEPVHYNDYYEMPPAATWDNYRDWNINNEYGNDIDDEYYDAMNNEQYPEVHVPEPEYDKLAEELIDDAPWHPSLEGNVPNHYVPHDKPGWEDYKQDLRDKVDEMAGHDTSHLESLFDAADGGYTNLYGPERSIMGELPEDPWAEYMHKSPDEDEEVPEGQLFNPITSPDYPVGYTNHQAQEELLNAIRRHQDEDGRVQNPVWVQGHGSLPWGEAQAVKQGDPAKQTLLYRPNDQGSNALGERSEEAWKFPHWTYPDIPQEDEANRHGPMPYMAPDDRRLEDLRQEQHHQNGYERAQQALDNGFYDLQDIKKEVHPQPMGYGDDGTMSRNNGMHAGYRDWWADNQSRMKRRLFDQMQSGKTPLQVWNDYGLHHNAEGNVPQNVPHYMGPGISAWEEAAHAHNLVQENGLDESQMPSWYSNPDNERCPMCKHEDLQPNRDGGRYCPNCSWEGESGAGLQGTIAEPQPAGGTFSSVDEDDASDPAIMLEEWLKDLGSHETDPSPSIHHTSPEDLDYRPAVSPDPTAAYYPPGHEPKMADSQMPSTGDPLINLTPRTTPAWEGLTDDTNRVIECPKCHKRHPVGECVYDDPSAPNQDYQQMKRQWKNHDPNGENTPIGGDGAYATSSYDENGQWQVKDEDWSDYEPNYNVPFNMLQAAGQELTRYLKYNPQEQQDTDLLLNMVRRIMTDAGVPPSELNQQDILGVVNNALNLVGGEQPIHGEGSPDIYTQHTWPLFEQPETAQNWQQFPEGLAEQIPGWGEQPPAYWDDPRFPGKMRRSDVGSLDKVAARYGLEIRDDIE